MRRLLDDTITEPGICVEVWRPSDWDAIVQVLQGTGNT